MKNILMLIVRIFILVFSIMEIAVPKYIILVFELDKFWGAFIPFPSPLIQAQKNGE